MGIYISGMEMPRHCTECPFWHDGIWEHCLLNENIQSDDVPEMSWDYPAFCPLTEVPEPHGRLIDADKAVRDFHEYGISHMYDAVDLPYIMEDSPTVIERSE